MAGPVEVELTSRGQLRQALCILQGRYDLTLSVRAPKSRWRSGQDKRWGLQEDDE